jgi:hypothetical protein
MAISHAQRMNATIQWRWQFLIFWLLFTYISVIALLFLVKKMEFTPFEETKMDYIQINPFKDPLIIAPQQQLSGKGVVVRLNTLFNSIIEPSPEFNYLVFSQNILGHLCAQDPSQVKFVVYVKYEKHKQNHPKQKNQIIYQLQKRVAIVSWPKKELVAQKTFTKNYIFYKRYSGRGSDVASKLCLISEEPSDEEVKRWISSLAAVEAWEG